jgi:hypothetical protein
MKHFVPIVAIIGIVIASFIGCDKQPIQADAPQEASFAPPTQSPTESSLGKILDSTQRAFFAQAAVQEARVKRLSKVVMKPENMATPASYPVHFGPPE